MAYVLAAVLILYIAPFFIKDTKQSLLLISISDLAVSVSVLVLMGNGMAASVFLVCALLLNVVIYCGSAESGEKEVPAAIDVAILAVNLAMASLAAVVLFIPANTQRPALMSDTALAAVAALFFLMVIPGYYIASSKKGADNA